MSEFSAQFRVYYEDVDITGVMHNPHYLKFMERARVEWEHQLGINSVPFQDSDFAFLVRGITVDYLSPARFGELVRIVSKVERAVGATMEFFQVMIGEQEPHKILCQARTKLVYVNRDIKPAMIPKDYISTVMNSKQEAAGDVC